MESFIQWIARRGRVDAINGLFRQTPPLSVLHEALCQFVAATLRERNIQRITKGRDRTFPPLAGHENPAISRMHIHFIREDGGRGGGVSSDRAN